MQRRLIAALVAVVLAGIGTVLLYNWVSNANARALEGLDPVPVLVVTTQVPKNTKGSEIVGYVEQRELPRSAVASTAISTVADLSQIKDETAIAELAPGQQLLSTFFESADVASDGSVKVAANMQQLTISLDPAHAAGGDLKAGDKVAAYVQVDGVLSLLLPDILVTGNGAAGITMALEPTDVQRVMLGTQAGLWLVKSSQTTPSVSPMKLSQISR